MNTLDDLRRAVAAHTPDDGDLAARPAAVARRVQSVRRRRAAAVTLAAVAVIGGGAAVATLPGRDAGPGPAQDPTSTTAPDGHSRDGVTFRRQVGGGTLVDARIGAVGQREVSFSFVVPANPRLSAFCESSVPPDGLKPTVWAWISIDGWLQEGIDCSRDDDRETDPGGDFSGPVPGARPGLTISRPDGRGGIEERHLAPGTTATISVLLSDLDGRPYTGEADSAQLGVAVYAGP